MEKIINISGKDVKFKATSGTLIRYEMQFKKDMLTDLASLQESIERVKDNPIEQFKAMDLNIFLRMAWAMAKTADNNIPNIENWLDEFEMFSIYEILPQISELMTENLKTLNEKKNIVPQNVQNQ